MKRIFTYAMLAAGAVGCTDLTSPTTVEPIAPAQASFSRSSSVPIPGRYIVVFKRSVQDVDGEASVLARRHGGKIRHLFKSALHGVTLDLADAEVAALRTEPTVAYVEQDQTISINTMFDSPLVNAGSGQCLATQSGSSAALTAATVAACSGASAQLLSLPMVGTAGRVLLFGGTTCLDDFYAGGRVGDVVGIYPCNGGANQSWMLTSAGELRGINDLCVAVTGTAVTLQSCNGGASQRWTASTGTPSPAPTTRFDASLVSGAASGQCLGAANGSAASLTPMTVTTCSGAAGQTMNLPPVGTAGPVRLFAGTMCLDDFYAGGRVGDVVGIYACNGGANQSWTLTSAGELRGLNDLCTAASGASVTLQSCNASAGQRWAISTQTAPPSPSTRFDSPLVNVAAGQCLATQNGSSAALTAATVAACSGATAQLLSLPAVGSAGRVLLFGGTTCLDDFYAGGRVGDVVGIYPCNGGANQSWMLTSAGELRGINALCVAASGASVTLQSCNGAASQRWTTGTQTAPSPVPPTTTQTGADWGLDRMDQRSLPLNGSYAYQNDGTGVTAYILDSGINLTHGEFGGRATTGIDVITTGGNAADCNGHGTHVAGTVGGTTYGVAKKVRLVAVRVLDCAGSGTSSGLIAGIDWVTANRVRPAVANLSLGGGFSQAVNDALARSVAAGVVFAVAAGNSAVDACTTSPASAADAITVGATDQADAFASFSNYGSCVTLNAPGVSIASAWIGSNTATASASGTSMASPHVAGAAAVYLQRNPDASAAQVRAALTGAATSNVIRGIVSATPNLLVFSPSGT